MDSYYLMTFVTDLDKRVSVRINRAVANLPATKAIAAMDKVLAANCFDPANGNLVSKHSLKCVSTTVTPFNLD